MAPFEWLSAVHDPYYVRAMFEGGLSKEAERRIGFAWSLSVARRARASNAGTVLAARLALAHGAAMNAAGGSHHADAQGGAGFCVFNDVAVAAHRMLAEGRAKRILIFDCDVHQGDGTAKLFAASREVFTASLHCEQNWPFDKAASDLDVGLARACDDAAYMDALDVAWREAFLRARPDLVFYNAGVDPHIDDRLGRLNLTDNGLRSRDRYVVSACRQQGVPVVGVLGGGYSDDVYSVARRHVFLADALIEAL